MCTFGKNRPIRFAGYEFGAKPHVCAFFRTPDEEYRALLPFIQAGFRRGDKAFHVVDPKLREHHVQRLAIAGIDAVRAEHEGQLQLRDWNETYLPDGSFNLDRTLAMWQKEIFGVGRSRLSAAYLIAHMEWSLVEGKSVGDLLEYEARFNLISVNATPVICVYDVTKFTGDILVDILRAHPMTIVGGRLYRSPFFLPPKKFLKELHQRRDQQAVEHDRRRGQVDRRLRDGEGGTAELRQLFKALTDRQREVMSLVVTGRLNKQIAISAPARSP